MRKARLLSTVAATLLLTVGIASAQTMNKDEAAPARAPAAQQKAPAEKVAPAMKPGEQKASTKKTPDTIGQAAPKASEPGKTQTMDKSAPSGAAADVKPGAKGDVKSEATPKAKENEKSSENAGAKDSGYGQARRRKRPRDHRPRRGFRLGETFDRTTHQDHHHHQAAQGGTGASECHSVCRHPRSGQRAFLSAAGGSVRGLSRVARLRLHPGRRPDPRHRSALARDRRDP